MFLISVGRMEVRSRQRTASINNWVRVYLPITGKVISVEVVLGIEKHTGGLNSEHC